MELPRLYSPADPSAPLWIDVHMPTQKEYEDLKRNLGIVIGYDTNSGVIRQMGTGIVVGYAPIGIYVVTAAHVLTGFANLYLGALPTNIYDTEEDRVQKDAERVAQIISERKLKVLLETHDPQSLSELDVVAVGSGQETQSDWSILRCEIPPGLTPENFTPMLMDFEWATGKESLMMAGFSFSEASELPLEPANIEKLAKMRSNLIIRASRIAEVSTNPEGAGNGSLQWRVTMPSEPGMSGGPLIRLREPKGKPRFLGHNTPQLMTAVGVISRARSGGMFAGFEEVSGETWITPMEVLRAMLGDIYYIILSYQDVEPRLKRLPANFPGRATWQWADLLKEKLDSLKKLKEQNESQRQPTA
jgi:hypothetical protein